MTNWDNPTTNQLMRAILSLSDLDEAKRFFRDLLTERELRELGNRWQAAQLLDAKVRYAEIEKQTGLSSATVARIAKWLAGDLGGYRRMLDKTAHHHSDQISRG